MLCGVTEYYPSVVKEKNLSFTRDKTILWKFNLKAPGYVAVISGGLECKQATRLMFG